MKKILCFLIVLCILVQSLQICTYALNYKTAKEAIEDANDFIESKMGICDYYKLKIDDMELNEELAKVGSDAFSNRPVFVYGNDEQKKEASRKTTTVGREVVKIVNGKEEYRALGYAIDGSVFPNPIFPSDNEGYAAKDKMWIKEPWEGEGVRDLYGEDEKISKRNLTGNALEYIKKWINWSYFVPDAVEAFTGERNYFVENAVDVPEELKDNFADFLYIIQPPTEHSWGLGIAFYYWNGYNNLNYKSFLIEPFDMNSGDLSVNFCELPGSIAQGKKVVVGVRIKSNFDNDLENIDFEWNIRKADGTPLTAEKDDLVFIESIDVIDGKLNIPSTKKQSKIFAEFTMPDSNVIVEFEINRDGKSPIEKDIENNIISTEIEVVKPPKPKVEDFELPYYALSRDIRFPVANGEKLIAVLKKRSDSWWDGKTTGGLNIYNENKELFNKFSIKGNPEVGPDDIEIIRQPIIEAVIDRKNFGDDPLGRNWFNSGNLYDIILSRTAKISYEGSVTKPYYYIEPCNDDNCEIENCPGHRQNGRANSSFPSNRDEMRLTVKVYNGKETLQKKELRNEITRNGEGFKWSLLWPNTAIQFNVIRYMCHLDSNGQVKNNSWVAVPGRYKREFVQQCSADIDWNAASSMEQDYEQDRKAASEGKQGETFYKKAG
ncbi:MAG TPA: hypothetical protein PLK32_09040 [Defluviitoga tunisiensis]|mgnify:CR=1 FL=1|nr:hypothetical protein [Defluviitoga tunisiensis]